MEKAGAIKPGICNIHLFTLAAKTMSHNRLVLRAMIWSRCMSSAL